MLDEDLRWQAQESLLVGIPAAPGSQELVMRDVLSVDRRSGVIEIRGAVQVGQSIQYCLADPVKADADLRDRLSQVKSELMATNVLGAMLSSALTRGIELFHIPDHDIEAVKDALGDVPVGGFFSAGEIASEGSRALLHGATATLTLFIKK